jgi:hypothetical protein
MATLTFKNEGLRRILNWTRKSTTFRNNFSQAVIAYEKETGKEYNFADKLDDKYYEAKKPALWFVKDSGIYLMPNGDLPGKEKDDKSHVCYAKGYEPDAEDSWEKCRAAVGGDDFVEQIDFNADLQREIDKGCDMKLSVTKSTFRISFVMPRPAVKDKIS